MKDRVILFVGTFVLLLASACTGGRHELMLQQLSELERQNVADSVMTNDSLTEALVDYFDRHGSANERLRAYYILGRTYADLGEAPAAISAYHNAADCADTTAADCDFAKLSRVYAQMSDVLYRQGLYDEYLRISDFAIKYAWIANDTVQALRESMLQLLGYEALHQTDTLMAKFDRLYESVYKYCGKSAAARHSAVSITGLWAKKDYERLRKCLNMIEYDSGYFNSEHQIEKGREAFYYFKGMYFLDTQQYDSAKYCFYKELRDGLDADNQQRAARGLSLLYSQTHQPDSAAKYAIYSYEMNDSCYRNRVTHEVEQMHALYNYSRHEKIAEQEKEKRLRESQKNKRLYVFLVIVTALFLISLLIWRKKKKEAFLLYVKKKDELEQAKKDLDHLNTQRQHYERMIEDKVEVIGIQQSELTVLRSHEVTFANLIKDKEKTIIKKENELKSLQLQKESLISQIEEERKGVDLLQKEIGVYQHKERIVEKNAENSLADSMIYQKLQKKANTAKSISSEDWLEIETLVKEVLPGFCNVISRPTISSTEYKICMLLRLHVKSKQICGFLGLSPSNLSKICSAFLRREFQKEGSTKELQKQLEGIC